MSRLEKLFDVAFAVITFLVGLFLLSMAIIFALTQKVDVNDDMYVIDQNGRAILVLEDE